MCGIVYFKSKTGLATSQQIDLLIELAWQSRIRGLHSFGVTFFRDGKMFNPCTTYNFDDVREKIKTNSFDACMVHSRYDTSGDYRNPNNNQPIVIGNNVLIFNGVIRQSTKAEYEQEFGRSYKTENDGEIILDAWIKREGSDKFLNDPKVSFAGIAYVQVLGTFAIRNERRPLWHVDMDDAEYVVSTQDIWMRARQQTVESDFHSDSTLREIEPMEVLWL